MTHQAVNGNWTRSYAYNEASLSEAGRQSNRLSQTALQTGANPPVEAYAYDAHGNMTRMPHLPIMRWNFRDELSSSSRQVVKDGAAATTYYVYDASGQRARKITEGQGGALKSARFYLGGFETYREYSVGSVRLERQSLHVMDDKHRIALVDRLTIGDVSLEPSTHRYQVENNIYSSKMEIDSWCNVISYEEYAPFGNTSYQVGGDASPKKLKQYRYTGTERDEESGFNYHGARYYASWLGRWTIPDPSGIKDGLNLFCYARSNPISHFDHTGNKSTTITIESETIILNDAGKIKTATRSTSTEHIDGAGKRTVVKSSTRSLTTEEREKAQTHMDQLKQQMKEQVDRESEKPPADEDKNKKNYKLVLAINPSGTDKKGLVTPDSRNPGHTFVVLKDPDGKIINVLSYGPEKPTSAIGYATDCSEPGNPNYHLLKSDDFDTFEFDITKEQSDKASQKIDEIKGSPGRYSGTHQCTTVALEVSDAAGQSSIPRGKGTISPVNCPDAVDVPTPYNLDKDLKDLKVPYRVQKGSDFGATGLPLQ